MLKLEFAPRVGVGKSKVGNRGRRQEPLAILIDRKPIGNTYSS
jgi:hypothetical protein